MLYVSSSRCSRLICELGIAWSYSLVFYILVIRAILGQVWGLIVSIPDLCPFFTLLIFIL